MRSRKYGTQPMPPSLSATLRFGNFLNTGDHTRSAAHFTMFIGCNVIIVSIGASIAVITVSDDEPMWTQMTVFRSSHARKKESQWSLCQLGLPSFSGFSEKV